MYFFKSLYYGNEIENQTFHFFWDLSGHLLVVSAQDIWFHIMIIQFNSWDALKTKKHKKIYPIKVCLKIKCEFNFSFINFLHLLILPGHYFTLEVFYRKIIPNSDYHCLIYSQ